jgi:Mg-chelatase subunit ChlD
MESMNSRRVPRELSTGFERATAATNLVFLVDVSESMIASGNLEILKRVGFGLGAHNEARLARVAAEGEGTFISL